MKKKLYLNSSNAKQIIVENNEIKERLKFNSITSAVQSLGIDDSYFRRYIKNNKPCKGYTIIVKQKKIIF